MTCYGRLRGLREQVGRIKIVLGIAGRVARLVIWREITAEVFERGQGGVECEGLLRLRNVAQIDLRRQLVGAGSVVDLAVLKHQRQVQQSQDVSTTIFANAYGPSGIILLILAFEIIERLSPHRLKRLTIGFNFQLAPTVPLDRCEEVAYLLFAKPY